MSEPITFQRHRDHDLFAPLQGNPPSTPPPRPCPLEVAANQPGRTDLGSVMRFIATHTQPSVGATRTVLGNEADKARGESIQAFLGQYTMQVNGAPPFVVPFRMVQSQKELGVTTNALIKELGGNGAPGASVAGYVAMGRARPDEMKKVVDALAARHPEKFTSPDRARTYLRQLGVGVDCAGFVQLALSRVHGGSRPPFGLLDRGMENLSRLGSNPSFRRVGSPIDARPGDVITLKPPGDGEPGHTVIVTECATTPGSSLTGVGVDLQPSDRVVLLKVASSWGGGRGPQEVTWTYNERTHKWGTLNETTGSVIESADPRGPYNHALEGIFHPAWKTRS